MGAPQPFNEAERLLSLQDFNILDTIPEQSYDDLTQLAAMICQAPIALISFIDSYRQWFKSAAGVDIGVDETPRDHSFCTYAIMQPTQLMVVEDATKDVRFADNPLVTGHPYIRFYAGAPLVTDAGHALGTLCVIDTKPNRISPTQTSALQALARQVMEQLQLRHKIRKLSDKITSQAG